MKAKTEQQFIESLGKRIAKIRKEKGLTQEKLAAEADLDRVAIAYIETGKRKPKVSSIYKISAAMNIDPAYLFRDL